ncbi:ANTAR domain-containing protein [Streptomyces sp. NPDC002790]|uniref:ANTAR domain-containing protein n=1 Tax=Streptomyces sp. NPDC002790 TaxID=3154431 RepID=UPI00332BAA76
MEPRDRPLSQEQVTEAWERSVRAQERADREFRLAKRYEDLVASTRDERYVRLGLLHRSTASRHLVAAELLAGYVRRAAASQRAGGQAPPFMAGVAEACGAGSVAVTLVDAQQNQVATAYSDQPAREAQDLEYVLGEGPARDSVLGRSPVVATGAALATRWPGYGPALAALGFGQVVAVPLQSTNSCIGALAVFSASSAVASTPAVSKVAEALTRSVFLGQDAVPGLFGDIDHRAEVHQAAGMVAVHLGCRIADALELVKARSFADARPIGDIAHDIVNGHLKLG